MTNSKKCLIIGIGEFGCLVVKKSTYASVLVDWRLKILENVREEQRFRLRKSADVTAEAERFLKKFKKNVSLVDIIFIVVRAAEEGIRDFGVAMAEKLHEADATTVVITVLPDKNGKKRPYRQAENTMYAFCDRVATVVIPLGRMYLTDTVPETEEDIYDSLGAYDQYNFQYDIRKTNATVRITEKEIGLYETRNVVSQETVAVKTIEKIADMTELAYINATPETAKSILKTPGRLHITSAHNSLCISEPSQDKQMHRAYILKQKMKMSGLLGTDAHYVTKMLLHLTVPPDITEYELQYLCEHLSGMADLQQFELSITVEETANGILKAEAIGINAMDEDEWESLFGV